jgi:hypothetical protein
MIAGNDEGRHPHSHAVEEDVSRLELAVACPLADVTGDDEGRRIQGWEELLQRLDLLEIGIAAEMKVGQMGNDHRPRCCHDYQITLTRYVSTVSPRAGTRTLKRVTVDDTFSGDTELATTLHSPARSSWTSIVAAVSVAFFRVTR